MPPQAARKVEREVIEPTPTGQTLSANDNKQSYRKVAIEETLRPRDAAIRALNDTARPTVVVRDINPPSNYPTVDQEFRRLERGTGEQILAENESSKRTGSQSSSRYQEANRTGNVARHVSKRGADSLDQRGRSRSNKNPRKMLTQAIPDGNVKSVAERAYATQVTLTIFPWATGLWLTFQLPFALLAIVFFGLAGALESAKETLVGGAIAFVTSSLSSVIDTLFDIDLSQFNPENFFIITNTATMFVGFATLLAMGLVYTIAGVPSLSGKAAGLKYATLIIALMGYSLPVLNMFPWAIFWALAVWFYPTD